MHAWSQNNYGHKNQYHQICICEIIKTDLITSSPLSQGYHGVSIVSLSSLMESLVEVTGTTISVSPLKTKQKLINRSDNQITNL